MTLLRESSHAFVRFPYRCQVVRGEEASHGLSSHGAGDFGRRYGRTSESLGVNPSVAGGAETDGVKTRSGFGHRLLSGVGHRSYVGH